MQHLNSLICYTNKANKICISEKRGKLTICVFLVDESDVDLTNADISDGVYKRYVDDDLFHYQEFAKRENRNIDVFRAQVSLCVILG